MERQQDPLLRSAVFQLDTAMHQRSGYGAMKDIARRQRVSKEYGDQIGMQLSPAVPQPELEEMPVSD